MAGNEAKIKLTAEDATAAAFGAVVKNINSVKSELASLPATFTKVAIASAGIGSLAGFASMISGVVEGRAKLRDLSIQTNISVEGLASLSRVAKLSDTPLESIASASNKLAKSLFSQTEESKGAAQAIQALGLNFDKFKSLTPEQQLLEVAKALDQFQDGSEKSAAAMLLFGKQGAEMLPFLKDLSERGLEAAKVTTQQAEEAKKYEENLRALKAAGDEWKKTLADEMLPALLEFSRELLAGRQAYGSWFGALVGIGTTNPFNTLGENLTKARDNVKALEDELSKAAEGQTQAGLVLNADVASGAAAGRSEADIQHELASARQRYDYFKRLQAMQAGDLGKGIQDDPRIAIRKGKLVLPDANGASDALLKKQFEGQLKLIADFAQQQRDAYEYANKYLKGVYDDGLTSLADFFSEQKRLRDGNVQAELDSIDKQIAAANALKAKTDKPELRQEAENKIADAVARRAKVVQDAAQNEVLANQENERQIKQTSLAYYDFLASIASLKGDTAQAFELTLPKKIEDARLQFAKFLSPEEAQKKASALEPVFRELDALARAQSDYNRLTESQSLTEKGIAIDAQLAGATELDTLRRIGAERQQQLPLLQQLAEQATLQAQALGSPDALLAAQKLTLAFKQAQLEADPVFAKIRDIGKEFGDALSTDAEDAILHWQGARQLLLQIEQDILRIATRKLFTEPLGNYLTNAIGGNGTSGGGGGLLGQLFGSVFGAGSGGGGGGGFGTGASFGNLDFGGFFAEGGTIDPGHWGIVGEAGPETIYAGATPVHVTPMQKSGGGAPVYISISVPPNTTRNSASQMAALVGDRVSSAMRRSR